MNVDPKHQAEGAKSAMLMFADISTRMIAIRQVLGEKPGVASATRGCDIRLYQNSCCFESYVETETDQGAAFSWLLDVTSTSTGWSLQRWVVKEASEGAQVEIEFQDFVSNDFAELAGQYAILLTEFEESAKNFDFSSK